jgi:hypothetical protein
MEKYVHTATATEILDDIPGIDVPQAEIERSLRALEHEKLWMNYDQENDSLTIYFTGQPVHGRKVQMGVDHYAIVDPCSHRVVGLYLENVVHPDKQPPSR